MLYNKSIGKFQYRNYKPCFSNGKEVRQNEAHNDFTKQKLGRVNAKRRMWRVPDVLSERLQNILHCGQPELREKINHLSDLSVWQRNPFMRVLLFL